MNLRQLQYFVQIAKSGGFNRASAALHIAQPALSRHMRQLEGELGVELFERSARGIQLTLAGEFMVERAQSLLRQFSETKDQLYALSHKPRGRVAFGIPVILREALAIPVVGQFNELYPEVEITFVAGLSPELREWILNGKIDLGVLGLLEPETTLKTQPLMLEDLIAVGTSAGPFAGRDTITIDRMCDVPLAVSSREQLRLVLKRTARPSALNLSRVPEINDSALLIKMVLGGRYFSILPRCMVQPYLDSGQLHGAVLAGIQYQWVVAHLPDRVLSAAARTIQSMLMAIASERKDKPVAARAERTKVRAGRTQRSDAGIHNT